MGDIIEYHPKYLERLVKVFLEKNTKEGAVAAQEWADRTLNPELIAKLIPLIHKKKP